MTKGIKIVTIGGGSSYTPELVEGIIKRYEEELSRYEISILQSFSPVKRQVNLYRNARFFDHAFCKRADDIEFFLAFGNVDKP